MKQPLAMLSSFRWLPMAVGFAAIAFGAHAGEAVKGITQPKVIAPTIKPGTVAKPAAAQTRTEVRYAEEMKRPAAKPVDDARQIELRERLAEASERRIDAKLMELRGLQTQQSQQQTVKVQETNQQFSSLVKVYEQMKPKDAARIFEKLDMGVQLAVATRMREQRMAAIMAEMTPEGARALTMELATQARIGRKS
jgi:flagellar motility protein MotE (MotC chaperone)